MADRDAAAPRRRRGRPRGGRTDAREQILAAAATEFGDRGYDGATIRTIAERAGVDAALVHHYFGTKADLFAAVIDIPINPANALPEVVGTDLHSAGERLVRFVLELWDDPAFRERGVAMLRSVIGSRKTASLMVGFLSRELIRHIGDRIAPGDEGRLRASLVASQVVGLMITRYVLELEPIASTPPDDVVSAIGPTLQRYLTGDLTPAAPDPADT